MADSDDPTKVQKDALLFREHYAKQAIEAQKQATEYGKLIITNLVWINAAGVGSLHYTIDTLGIDKLKSHDAIISIGYWFIVGLSSALISAFAAYLNFGFASLQHYEAAKMEVTYVYESHDEGGLTSIERFTAVDSMNRLEKKASITRWGSYLLGTFSFLAFIYACYLLVHANAI